MGPITIPTDIDSLSKKSATTLLDRLFAAPRKGATAQAPTASGPSEKQIALITKLYGEKDWAGVVGDFDVDTAKPVPDLSKLTPGREGTASKLIDALFAAPRKQAKKAATEIPAGAYRVQDRIVRVYYGRESGQMLAAELVDVTATDRSDAWHYLGRADRFVDADAHRLTAEEAEAINDNDADHGWCCVCGAYLDDPNSVRRGIGPVCRAKQGGI